MPKKDNTRLKKPKTPEEKVQFLYKEVFYMSDLLNKVFTQQEEIGKLLTTLLKEYKNIQDFDKKFLK